MRILIADDHCVVRRGIKMLLAESYPNAHIEEVVDSAELLLQQSKSEWDLIISDISMPGRSGAEVIKELKALSPRTPILILSTHPPEQYALRTIKAGAAGYLCKDATPEQLIKAIEYLLSGKRFLTEEVADVLAQSINSPDYNENPHQSLSDREFEILKFIVSGKTILEIADILSINKNSLRLIRIRILKKMGMETNAELIR